MANPEFCSIHTMPMQWHESKTKFNEDGSPKTYLSHKTLDGKLCFGNPKKASETPSQPVSEYIGNQSHSQPIAKTEKSSFNTCNAMNNAAALIVGGVAGYDSLEEIYDNILRILEK